jgi:hypothetical protein
MSAAAQHVVLEHDAVAAHEVYVLDPANELRRYHSLKRQPVGADNPCSPARIHRLLVAGQSTAHRAEDVLVAEVRLRVDRTTTVKIFPGSDYRVGMNVSTNAVCSR